MTINVQPELDALSVTVEAEAGYVLQSGRVLRRSEAGAVVLVGGREQASRCAASCLVVPEPGDLVLLAAHPTERFILAVLHRPGSAPAVLSATTPSDQMVLSAGKLALKAKDDIELTAPQATIRSGRLTFAADALAFVAKLLTQTLGRWQSSSQNMDMVATDMATKAARRVTLVDESDMLQAGSVLQKIQSTSVTQAEAVVIAVNEDLRLDGARVTVG
jgi:hypothetical protein